jgi:hypothetical protein
MLSAVDYKSSAHYVTYVYFACLTLIHSWLLAVCPHTLCVCFCIMCLYTVHAHMQSAVDTAMYAVLLCANELSAFLHYCLLIHMYNCHMYTHHTYTTEHCLYCWRT